LLLIIVDGPDCAGKSTLVSALVDRLVGRFPGHFHTCFHKNPPTAHPLAEYVEPLLGYRPGQGHHVVTDRWHWGEAVYPDLFDRPTRMDPGVWRYTEMFLRSRGAMVVYPQVEPEEMLRRYMDRGDDLVSAVDMGRADQSFRALAVRSRLPVFRFRGDLVTLASRVETMINEAMVYEREASRLNFLETYVGPARVTHLLVGDERPPRMDRDHPAFMPYAPRSGHFLLNALRGRNLGSLGIVNANDVDSVGYTWEVVGRPDHVVALGRLASRRLDQAGIVHSRVPHPQFVRRFYQRHRDEYGLAIAEALSDKVDLSGWRPANPSWRSR
jgi:thymidylate kinase